MTHTFTTRRNRRYRYYTCSRVVRRGRRACPTPSLPAAEVERVVVEEVRRVAQDPGLVAQTAQQVQAQTEAVLRRLEDERRAVERVVERCHTELRRLAAVGSLAPPAAARVAELNDRIRDAEQRLAAIAAETAEARARAVRDRDVAAALADFDGLWEELSPRERVRVVHLLVGRVEFDAGQSTIEVSFHPVGAEARGEDSGPPVDLTSTRDDGGIGTEEAA